MGSDYFSKKSSVEVGQGVTKEFNAPDISGLWCSLGVWNGVDKGKMNGPKEIKQGKL